MAEIRSERRVVLDPALGYRRLDPLPENADLDDFYESAYVHLVRDGRRFPELAYLLAEGGAADEERAWLRATLHSDMLEALEATAHNRSGVVVDVGCGIGEFVASATEAGWNAIGLEPSIDAVNLAVQKGRRVLCTTLERYAESGALDEAPTAVIATNVLEHLRDPASLLGTIRQLAEPGTTLIVRVPNDFNPLQESARAVLQVDPWWVAYPDHLNYFDHTSIRTLVTEAGFDVVDQWADFPMELFLLMGDDYVANPSLGRVCHARRRRLELSLDTGQRRAFGHALVDIGWGRNSVVVAVARSTE